MISRLKIVLLVTGMSYLRVVCAQSDYVVTSAGDTLFGNITTPKVKIYDRGEVKIRPTVKNKNHKEKFSADEVVSFRKDNIVYVSQVIKELDQNFHEVGSHIFVREMVRGKLLVYMSQTPQVAGPGAMAQITNYYFRKENENNIIACPKSKKKVMEYFQDCDPVKAALENKKIKHHDYEALANLYNGSCR